MERLAIIGSGDLGQLIAYHATNDNHYHVAGFFDDYKRIDEKVDGFPVLGGINDVSTAYRSGLFDCLMIAIGYKHFPERKACFERFAGEIPYGRIVHSSSYIDPSCQVGKGGVILPGCILDRMVVIEDNVLINTGSCIAHDSVVKKHSFLSPGVTVAGFSVVGECCNIGIGTIIIDNITLCDNVQTGGGTVVIKDLDQNGLYVGNPARFIREK